SRKPSPLACFIPSYGDILPLSVPPPTGAFIVIKSSGALVRTDVEPLLYSQSVTTPLSQGARSTCNPTRKLPGNRRILQRECGKKERAAGLTPLPFLLSGPPPKLRVPPSSSGRLSSGGS